MMDPTRVRVKLWGTKDISFLPVRQTIGSAGMDLKARIDEELALKPMERALIPTGISVALPRGYECQVRPRSGLAVRFGVTLLNTPGTVDPDYRGEIQVILVNLGRDDFIVKRGDRIAQIVFSRTVDVDLELVEELDGTGRGEGGFGSTGR